MEVINEIYNLSNANMFNVFSIPFAYVIGGKNLTITQTKIGVSDADIDDFVNNITWYGTVDHTTPGVIVTDGTIRTAPGTYTYNHADITVGGTYEKVVLVIDWSNTDATDAGMSWVQIEYYYA